MKAILEYTLPEEAGAHRDALNGAALRCAVLDFDQALRAIVKFGAPEGCPLAGEQAEWVRAELRSALEGVPGFWE